MTYEARYALIAAGKHYTDNATLYEACKVLEAAAKAGATRDATHIRRGNRPVAFWCEWDNCIKPMFGANDTERAVLNDWR